LARGPIRGIAGASVRSTYRQRGFGTRCAKTPQLPTARGWAPSGLSSEAA
jgi:hypothetical protein